MTDAEGGKAHAPPVSTPKLPTATRAVASQVGIRAREPLILAEVKAFHACFGQWHEDSPYSLYFSCCGAAPDSPQRLTGFPFHLLRRPLSRRTPATRTQSAREPRVTVNAAL